MNLSEPLLELEGTEKDDESQADSSSSGTGLEQSGYSVSGPANVEALPLPVSARTARFRPHPLQPIQEPASAENKSAAGATGAASAEDRDDVLGGGGEGGEGYYVQKFSKFYTAFIATTSSSQVMPRASQHHPLASPLDVPEIEGDVDGMPTTPVTRDEAYEGIDTFNRSMSVPFGSLGVQRGRGAGGRGEMLRQSASIEPMAFGAGRGRGGTFKRSASLGATALGPSQSRAASFKRSNTLSSIGTRANTAVVAASASGRSAGRQRVAPRFSISRPVSAETKTSELFAEPLTSEGEGSVFPVDLPMEKRVALEVAFIQKYDKLAINLNVGEFWMLIDAHWISRWSLFVMGQEGPPGPISNRRLFGRTLYGPSGAATEMAKGYLSDASTGSSVSSAGGVGHPLCPRRLKIRPGLQAIKDYRAIHPLVWFIFREIYDTDGAPDLCRTKLDVYSHEVLAARRARILEPSHTTAVYQLRRFVARTKRDMLAEKETREAKETEAG